MGRNTRWNRTELRGYFLISFQVTTVIPVFHSKNLRFHVCILSVFSYLCVKSFYSGVEHRGSRKKRAHFSLLCVVFDAPFHILMLLICLTSPETSSLATWMGMTTLTASLWGECLKSSLSLSSHVILPFLYLMLPSVSYLSRSGLPCNASPLPLDVL